MNFFKIKMDIVNDLKNSFRYGGILAKLIYINVGVFVIAWLINSFAPSIVEYFMLPADGMKLLMQPWSLLSYMFLHTEFMHILFNMLWLYWFGLMFTAFFNPKQLLNVYLAGGLAGGLFYILVFNLVPELPVKNSLALGASASVMAVVLAVATYKPKVSMYLLFFGEVKIIYIALFALVLDALFLFSGQNVGGHLAHLGGAALGWFFAYKYKAGQNILLGFERFMDSFFSLFGVSGSNTKKTKAKMTVNYGTKSYSAPQAPHERQAETSEIAYNARKKAHQDKIDAILDKISKSGYDSLTKEEKEILFNERNK
jgi:membrane associated rhomboid family serine protease